MHGLFGYDRIKVGPWVLMEYFRGIRQYLTGFGNRVLVPQLSKTASIERRAVELKKFLDLYSPHEPVHLIAHSMGGLDARQMITHLGMAKRVLSLTTLGTPHRGSSYADWGLRRFERLVKPMFQFLRVPHRAFIDLSTQACTTFNLRTPDVPSVRYFSVAGHCEGPWLTLPWQFSKRLVEAKEGPNDGVVSVASATYGEHTDLWEGDHLNLINYPNLGAVRHGLWTDRAVLYGGLVRRLADHGF